jgi:hypothetical protein
VDWNGRNVEDGRVVVVPAQTIFTWAYGKPSDYDPRERRPLVTNPCPHLPAADRATMLCIMRSGVLSCTEGEPEPAAVPDQIVAEAEQPSSDV